MKKIEKNKNGGFTPLESIFMGVIGFLTLISFCGICLSLMKISERTSRTVSILNAIPETLIFSKSESGILCLQFNRVGDIYDNKPYHHQAKIGKNGQVIELDGKPVKEVLVEIPAQTPEKSVSGH